MTIGRLMRDEKIKKYLRLVFQLGLDFWTHPSNLDGSVDIRVTEATYPRLAKRLNANGIKFTILIPDIKILMDHENPQARSGRIGFDYARYNRLKPVKHQIFLLSLGVIDGMYNQRT